MVNTHQTHLRVLLITALVYWVLLMSVWGTFAFDRGLVAETFFPVYCQQSLQNCLLYPHDYMRAFNSLFLGASHLLSFGNGSYVVYTVIYGLLWWGKGMAMFGLLWQLFPSYPLVAFMVGALAIVHTSDYAYSFLGQMHQLGFVCFLALSVFFLVAGWKSDLQKHQRIFYTLALVAQFITLWTYEAHFFLVLAVPVILFVSRPRLNRQLLMTSALWYVLPAIYGCLLVLQYLVKKANNYQTGILRHNMSPSGIVQDWIAHIEYSLRFWDWVPLANKTGIGSLAPIIASLSVVAFVIGVQLLSPSGLMSLKIPPMRSLWLSLVVGGLFLILSFPVYTLIATNREYWRTQILGALSAAVVLVALVLLLSYCFPKPNYRPVVAIVACSIILFSGVQSGVHLQSTFDYFWNIQRQTMTRLAQIIPDVKDQTLILMVGTPQQGHPFMYYTIWFDFPLKIMYPNRSIAGYFINASGELPPDIRWQFTSQGMEVSESTTQITESAMQIRGFKQVNYDQIIALQYTPTGQLELLKEIPVRLLPKSVQATGYDPENRIVKAFVGDRVTRMFAR